MYSPIVSHGVVEKVGLESFVYSKPVMDKSTKRRDTLADLSMTLLDYLRNVGMDEDLDLLRESVRVLSQLVIEAEAEQQIGAGRYERSAERKTQRNGYRDRTWETRVGEIPLRIPKLRQGSFFPSLLEPRKRSEKALLAVVQNAYVQGVSTRKADDLLQGLGLTGIDKSKVSRICKQQDDVVVPFREY